MSGILGRMFGRKKEEKAPTLDDASKSIDSRTAGLDERIKKLDQELLKYKQQMAKLKRGPAFNQVKAKAMKLLQQKRMYEKQRESLATQSFNLDQTKFAQENIKDTATTVKALKAANTSLKASFKEVKIEDIEDIQDDMSDLLQQSDEIQQEMGRTFGNVEEVDEGELLDELNALETDIDQETEAEAEKEDVPAFLVSAASATKAAKEEEKKVVLEGGGGDDASSERKEAKSSKEKARVPVSLTDFPSVPNRPLHN